MIRGDPHEVCEGGPVIPVRYRCVEDDSFLSYVQVPPLAWGDTYLGPKGHIFDDGG